MAAQAAPTAVPVSPPAAPLQAPAVLQTRVRRWAAVTGAASIVGGLAFGGFLSGLLGVVSSVLAYRAAKRGNVRHLRFYEGVNLCHVVCGALAAVAIIILGSSAVSCACDDSCVASAYALTPIRYNASIPSSHAAVVAVNTSRLLRKEDAEAGAAPAEMRHKHRRHRAGAVAKVAHLLNKALRHSSAAWAAPPSPQQSGEGKGCPWAALRAHAAAFNMTWLLPHNGTTHGKYHGGEGHRRHGSGGKLWAALAKLVKDAPELLEVEEATSLNVATDVVPMQVDAPAAPPETDREAEPMPMEFVSSEDVSDVDSELEHPEIDESSNGKDRMLLRGDGGEREERNRHGVQPRMDGRVKVHPEDERKWANMHASEEEDDDDENDDEGEPNELGRGVLFGFLNDGHHRKTPMTKAEFVRAAQRTCDAGPGVILLVVSLVIIQAALHYSAAKAAYVLAKHPWTQAMFAASRNAAAATRSTSGFVPPAGTAPDPNVSYRFVPGHGFVPESAGVPTAVIPVATPAPAPSQQANEDALSSLRNEARTHWHAGRQWLRSVLSRGNNGRYERVGGEDPSTEIEMAQQAQAPPQQQQQHSYVQSAAPSMYAVPQGYMQHMHAAPGTAAVYAGSPAAQMPPPTVPQQQQQQVTAYPAGSPYTYAILPQSHMRI